MSEQQEIADSLKRILFYLDNDNKTGKKGLVTEIDDLKTEVAGLKNTLTNFIAEYRQAQAVQKAKVGLLSLIGGGIVAFITQVILRVIK